MEPVDRVAVTPKKPPSSLDYRGSELGGKDREAEDQGLKHGNKVSESSIDHLDEVDRSTLSYNSSTELRLGHFKNWLQACQRTHEYCKLQFLIPGFRPTRLLDVDAFGASRIQLCVSEDSRHGENMEYLTLSHCWGKKPVVRLLKSNFSAMRESISFDILSQTFRDAVTVTRKMGIRFLWIDSLCIIQDSAEDWRAESAQMDKVYGNALCNLAATSSEDGNGGLFRPKDRYPTLVTKCLIEPEWADYEKRQFLLVDAHHWDHNVYDLPLCQRAWVLQELLLAPRVIHFGPQLCWECKTMKACEMFPEELHSAVITRQILLENREVERKDQSEGNAEGQQYDGAFVLRNDQAFNDPFFEASRHGWQSILETYTSCQLTFGGDKLIALSGIVKRMQRQLDDTYVAGLWRNDLARQLLWTVEQNTVRGSLSHRSTEYRAPSWSWAAIDAPLDTGWSITKAEKAESCLVEILHCHVESVGPDSAGQVKAASVQLLGTICPVTMVPLEEEDPDRSKEWWMNGAWSMRFGEEQVTSTCCFDVSPKQSQAPVYFLPVMGEIVNPAQALLKYVKGVLLTPETSRGQGVYSRIGAALIYVEPRILEQPAGQRAPVITISPGSDDGLLYEKGRGRTLTLL